MSNELAQAHWELPELERTECGVFGDFAALSNEAKEEIWNQHNAHSPTRVPQTIATNNRVFLLDSAYNTDGLLYQRVCEDAEAMLIAQLRWQYLLRMRHHHFCDLPTGLPDKWHVSPSFHNIGEADTFGCSIKYNENDVPCTTPIFEKDDKRAVFDVDIDHQLERGIYARGIQMTHEMREIAAGKTFFGSPIEVSPYASLSTDGPMTMAIAIFGSNFLRDVRRDPDFVHEFFDFFIEAGLKRVNAFREYWDLPDIDPVWIADDAIANISVKHYREFVLPYHQKWYDALDPKREKDRGMHLCGDATRHFKTIADGIGVTSFDTGFPVDFPALREELGPDIEIFGGVEVPLLLNGKPEEVYDRAKQILTSGVSIGKRFVMREANNLPPCVPWANLAAMYKATLDFGSYE